jgi:plastocyanin
MKLSFMLVLAALLTQPAISSSPAAPAVHIKNDAFTPRTLAVNVGQTVTFTNDDDDAHTVTATDGSFDSKGLDTNAVWRHAFTKPGTYEYFCQLHPFMKGTIVVKAVSS